MSKEGFNETPQELIDLFEKLKNIKIDKFSSSNTHIFTLDAFSKIEDKLIEYQDNIFALCDLEPYLSFNNSQYLGSVLELLRYYLYILYYERIYGTSFFRVQKRG